MHIYIMCKKDFKEYMILLANKKDISKNEKKN